MPAAGSTKSSPTKAGASRSDDANSTSATPSKSASAPLDLKDEAVLEYLKSKGMGSACLELTKILNGEKDVEGSSGSSPDNKDGKKTDKKKEGENKVEDKKESISIQQDMEQKEEEQRHNRGVLTKSTGGGFGYDRDAAAPIAQWGVPDNPVGAAAVAASKKHLGEEDAKSYLHAFCALQIWVLSLPDDTIVGPSGQTGGGAQRVGWQPRTVNVIAKAKALIENRRVAGEAGTVQTTKTSTEEGKEPGSTTDSSPAVVEVVSEKDEVSQPNEDTVMADASAMKDGDQKADGEGDKETAKEDSQEKGEDGEGDKQNDENQPSEEAKISGEDDEVALEAVISQLAMPAEPIPRSAAYPLPPSAKPELLAVSFALLVHTYCELLEAGMEYTAHVLRDAFKPVYDPLYGEQYKDLYFCNTTEDMVKLNTHNSQHMDGLSQLKQILFQIAQIQLKQEELSKVTLKPEQQEGRRKKLQEYNQTVGLLQQRHTDKSQQASQAFDKMSELPFLRRARAVRWQITLSTTSYGMLCQFLSQTTVVGGLLAMSTLLQTKCELHIEQRDPLPFTPACVLGDNSTSSMGTKYKDLNQITPVQWAAPVPRAPGKDKEGTEKSILPFPKFHLEKEYEDERAARRGKRAVEFNRALLVNGFRRLEALERKRDFEAMSNVGETTASTGVGSGSSTLASGRNSEDALNFPSRPSRTVADVFQPSILMSTLCANKITKERISAGPSTKSRNRSNSVSGSTNEKSKKSSGASKMSSFMWEESGIGITCAKLCPPDGRRIAIGCDDSAIRVWNLMDAEFNRKDTGDNSSAGDASQLLLGHKNGFPVFDLSWNRDGRSLLSAGGDGSIRLWDTQAQGPFGEVKKSGEIKNTPTSTTVTSNLTKKGILTSAAAREGMLKAKENLDKNKRNPDMTVPGLRDESGQYCSGAALAVYRGHAQHTPVWSVSFSPCGYYFASAGSDATARLWTTDRSVPVRLFTGHTSNSVHSVSWHPNANYVLTGSEDKTCRLWDIQTGRCVRLMNGCPTGIFKVVVDPSGQYAAGSDYLGTVHLWDLATGKKVTELRNSSPFAVVPPSSQPNSPLAMNHALAFSPCGSALATGGDNRCVQIWDIKKAAQDPTPILGIPTKIVPTKRTMILDLAYTKRNLLLSVGKYISAVPSSDYIKA
eukprot:CAMPEP_0113462410 /NCGR_PEP_ID=MMETSP0014_2-20120614/12073_1 /TAXON_ID=2857 /ORGANISM="Nitzschia sp." /LENGTH=1161 /DNA_ID=CAMNT_0000354263 /DNA_START=15 /DNA_END=3500 /DNA_ORIENTATION=+ /assembly_acc=CAM_ASM_000159